MNDIAQTGLKEPLQVDWEASSSKWQAPPPAFDAAGKPITYYGVVTSATEDKPDDGHLNYVFDVKIVKSGAYDGQVVRFVRASTKVFTNAATGEPYKGNPNKLANYLKSTGLQAKPQTNDQYRAAVKASINKPFPFTLDWEAYNKDNQESVKGYFSFPIGPTGAREAILHAGDVVTLTDSKGVPNGQTQVVKSEVLFANARLRYFQDPSKGQTK